MAAQDLLPPAIDHAFVINLATRPARIEKFRERVPFSAGVECFAAIDGSQIELTPELDAVFNDFVGCKGALGCAMSHYELWERVSKMPSESSVLILEDDVFFAERFPRWWNRMSRYLPADFDLLYFGGFFFHDDEPMVRELAGRHEGNVDLSWEDYLSSLHNKYFGIPNAFCTALSYLIRPSGATKLVEFARANGIKRGVDMFMCDRWRHMNVYATRPPLTWALNDLGSDIPSSFKVE